MEMVLEFSKGNFCTALFLGFNPSSNGNGAGIFGTEINIQFHSPVSILLLMEMVLEFSNFVFCTENIFLSFNPSSNGNGAGIGHIAD